TGGHGQRVARQGAGLVDRTQRRDVLHDFTLAAESAHRHAAADDLAEGGQIRGNAEMGLSAAQCHAETGHHLVEDQHYTMFVTDLAQAFEEARYRRYAVHVAGHRFDDDAGDFIADPAERFTHGSNVVIGQGQGVLGKGRRYARRAGYAEGQGAGAGLDQQAVGVTVVAALELDDGVAAGVTPGQADGAHGRLGTGADH